MFKMNTEARAVSKCDRKLRQYPVRCPLPRFGTLLPFKRHPTDVSAEHRLLEWADWLYPYAAMPRERFNKFRCLGGFASFWYPFGAEDQFDKFGNAVKLMIIVFVADDQYEEVWGEGKCRDIDLSRVYWSKYERMCDKLVDPRCAPMTDWPPYLVALYAVLDSICVEFNAVQRQRFVDAWREFGASFVAETELMMVKPHELTCAQQIVDIKVHSIGVKQFSMLIEYFAGDLAMTSDEWADTQLQAYIRQVAEHALFVNDLFSFGKEFEQTQGRLDTMFNAVAQTARFNQCSIREAMRVIIARVADTERSIIDKHRAIIGADGRACSPAVRLYVDSMIYLCGGNYKFHSVCDRYLVFDSCKNF